MKWKGRKKKSVATAIANEYFNIQVETDTDTVPGGEPHSFALILCARIVHKINKD